MALPATELSYVANHKSSKADSPLHSSSMTSPASVGEKLKILAIHFVAVCVGGKEAKWRICQHLS